MATTPSTPRAGVDPRARILAGLLLIAGWMALPWGWPLLAVALLTLVALGWMRVPPGRSAAAVVALAWMLVITVVVHGFSAAGHILWEVPWVGWTLTVEGLLQGLLFALRLVFVVLVAMALSLSVGPLEGLRAMERLARPLHRIGVPVAAGTIALGMALRFVPTLYDEAMSLRKALMARGWNPGRGVGGRVKAWVPLFIPVLASGLRRSDDLAETLVMRGYDPGALRGSMIEMRWGALDTLVMVLALVPYALLAL